MRILYKLLKQAQWLSDRRNDCVEVVVVLVKVGAAEASQLSLRHHNITVTKQKLQIYIKVEAWDIKPKSYIHL